MRKPGDPSELYIDSGQTHWGGPVRACRRAAEHACCLQVPTPSARRDPESSDEEKRRDKLKGMSEEEYQRARSAKKEEKRKRKEERKRRKSLGRGEAEAAIRGLGGNDASDALFGRGLTGQDVRRSGERAAEDEHPGTTGGDVTAGGLGTSELRAGGSGVAQVLPLGVKREAVETGADGGVAGPGLSDGGGHVADAEGGGSVLGKRGRDDVKQLGGLTSELDELEAEIGKVVTSPAEEERKRRRMREGSGGSGVGAEVGFANVGERALGDLGPQARGLGSPDEAEKKRQERLRRVKEMLGKKKEAASPGGAAVESKWRSAGESAGGQERGGPRDSGGGVELAGGISGAVLGVSRDEKVREAKSGPKEAQELRIKNTEGGGLRLPRQEERAKVNGENRETNAFAKAAEDRETKQIDRVRIKKEKGTKERREGIKDERGSGLLEADAGTGAGGAFSKGARGFEDKAEPFGTGEHGAEDAKEDGERREGEKKRKKNREEKRGSKPKKRMKSLDALLEEEASRPKSEVAVGLVKAEAAAEPKKAPPPPDKVPFKLKIRFGNTKPKP